MKPTITYLHRGITSYCPVAKTVRYPQAFLIFLILLLVFPAVSFAQWQDAILDYDHPFGNIDDIQKTADGTLWTSYTTFTDSFEAVLLRSMDGGDSWQVIKPVPDSAATYVVSGAGGLFAFDSLRLWISQRKVTDPGAFATERQGLFYSDDGGQSWMESPLPLTDPKDKVDVICFFDSDTGLVFLNASPDTATVGILRTTDAGMSWDTVAQELWPLNSIVSFISNHNISVRGDTIWVAGEAGIVLRSTDQGANWSLFEVDNEVAGPVHSVAFRDHLNGISVKGNVNNGPFAQTALFRTEDGGESWKRIPGPERIEAVSYVEGSGGVWLAEIEQRLSPGYLISKDDGQTWIRDAFPGIIGSFRFISPTEGYAGGRSISLFNNFLPFNDFPGIHMYKYTGDPLIYDPDFADTLSFSPKGQNVLPEGYGITAIAAISGEQAWAVASNRNLGSSSLADYVPFVVRTLDSGETWENVGLLSDTGRLGRDIVAWNAQTAWVSTRDFRVLHKIHSSKQKTAAKTGLLPIPDQQPEDISIFSMSRKAYSSARRRWFAPQMEE